MRVRIVVADRAEARFYDAERADFPLQLVHRMTHPEAHLRDRDFSSDRPGRVFDHAPGTGRRGAVAHHDTGGERSPKEHEAEQFARQIAHELQQAHQRGEFQRLVIMAEPGFLGLLRASIAKSLNDDLLTQIGKDLTRENERSISAHVPKEVYSSLP